MKFDTGPTANVSTVGPHQKQLLVTDSISGRCFLVDTGAQVSVVPVTLRNKHSGASDERLGKATYNARLVKADVKHPLLGADFLRQYNLLVDIRWKRLIEADTYASLPCSSTHLSLSNYLPICYINTARCYRIIQKFYNPISRQIQFVMVCNITSRQQQLLCTPDKAPDKPPDKLAVAKSEFEKMEKMGIIRKSNSPWASPLHIVLKNNGGWRPCGDYRTLNDITTPDRFPIPYIQDFSIQLSGKSIFFQKLISIVSTTKYQ